MEADEDLALPSYGRTPLDKIDWVEEMEDEEPIVDKPGKKKRSRTRRKKKAPEAEPARAKKKPSRRKKAVAEDAAEPEPTARRGRRKKSAPEAVKEEPAAERPTRKKRRAKKKVHEEEPVTPAPRKKALRKKKRADVEQPAIEEVKPRKRRRAPEPVEEKPEERPTQRRKKKRATKAETPEREARGARKRSAKAEQPPEPKEPARAARPSAKRPPQPKKQTAEPKGERQEPPKREPRKKSMKRESGRRETTEQAPEKKPRAKKKRTKRKPSGFDGLGLSDAMLAALDAADYQEPTPIQEGIIPKAIEGVDLMGQARTGTGKTAAFGIPLLEIIEEDPNFKTPAALILVPTRELAVQVRDEIRKLSAGRDVRTIACYGGKPIRKQAMQLQDGTEIVVGTPGRLLDLMDRRALDLSDLECVVLDEADRMLDIGFRPDIEKILRRCPKDRQTLLLSATLPPPVVRLAKRYMRDPETLDFSAQDLAVETIEQFYVTVEPERKFDALKLLLDQEQPEQAIIFCRTKRGADKLNNMLGKRLRNVAAIHGDLTQSVRDRVMKRFREQSVKYLVATDVVGRGIDVSGISHIINYDIPQFCDDYVHRVGRTGRMGREGVAYSFVTPEQGIELTRIEVRINRLLKRAEIEGFTACVMTKTSDEEEGTAPAKPVYGKPRRRVRRAL